MYNDERIGTDAGIIALNTYEGEGGKTLAGAKLRLYWRLRLDGRFHEIHFTNSKNSGKKRVFVDGTLVHQETVYRAWHFTHTFAVGAHLLSIVPKASDGGSSPRNIFSTKASLTVLRVSQHPHDLVFDERLSLRCDICKKATFAGTRFRCSKGSNFAVCASCYDEHGIPNQMSPQFELRINGLPFSSFSRKPRQNGSQTGRPPASSPNFGVPPSTDRHKPTASRPPATEPGLGASHFRPQEPQRREGAVAPESEGSKRYPFNLSASAFVEKSPKNSGNQYAERPVQKPSNPWQAPVSATPDQNRHDNKDDAFFFGLEPLKPSTPRSRRSSKRSQRSVSPRKGSDDYRGLMDASSDDDEDHGSSKFFGFAGTEGKAVSAKTTSPRSSNNNEWAASQPSQVASPWATHQAPDRWGVQQQCGGSQPTSMRTRKSVPTQLLPWEPQSPGSVATAFQVQKKPPSSKGGAPIEYASFLHGDTDAEDDARDDVNSADLDEQRAIMASLEVKPQTQRQAPDPWGQSFSDSTPWDSNVVASSSSRKASISSDPWTEALSVSSFPDSKTKDTCGSSADPWGSFGAAVPNKEDFPDPWSTPVGTSPWPDAPDADPWGMKSNSDWPNEGWPTSDWNVEVQKEVQKESKDNSRAEHRRRSQSPRNASKSPRNASKSPRGDKSPRNAGTALREALHNAEASGIEPGASIRVFGLTGAAHLNGLTGIVERWDSSNGRWIVSLESGETKSLRPSNCALVGSPPRATSSKPAKRTSIEKSPAETELQDLFPQVDLPVIQQALSICQGNVQIAADWLADHIPEEEIAYPSPASTSTMNPSNSTSTMRPALHQPLKVRRKALLIGINYFGTQAELRGCINDVWNMKRLLVEQFGWDSSCIHHLVDDNPRKMPTKANIDSALRWLVEDVRPGDILFFHFSGHGAQQEDPHGFEEDGMNETICPVDFQKAGMISDDEIGEVLVKNLPEGVRLTAVMDCCHSGTGLDLPFTWKGRWSEETNPYHSAGDVQLFSGCEDDDCSADAVSSYGAAGGAMTTAFCDVLRSGPVGPSYPELMASLDKLMRSRGFTQRPQLTSSQQFSVDRPFGLDDAVPNSNTRLGRTFRKKFPPRPRRMSGPLASMLDDAGLLFLGGMMAASAAPMAMDMGSSMFGMASGMTSGMGGLANEFFDGFWT